MFSLNSFCIIASGLILIGVTGFAHAQSKSINFTDFILDETNVFEATKTILKLTVKAGTLCELVEVSLYQQSGVLLTPVVLDSGITCNTISDSSGDNQALITFISPSVKKTTSFILTLTDCSAGKKECTNIAQTELRVYPKDLLEGLKKWSSVNVLRVDDPDGYLISVLEKNTISYTSAYTAPVVREPDTVVLTIFNPRKMDYTFSTKLKKARQYGHVMVFTGSTINKDSMLETLPGIFYQRESSRSLMKVNLPLIGYLNDKPRAQSLFMELFTRVIK